MTELLQPPKLTQHELLSDILHHVPAENAQEFSSIEEACLVWAYQPLTQEERNSRQVHTNPRALARLLTLQTLLRSQDHEDFQNELAAESLPLVEQLGISYTGFSNALKNTVELRPLIEVLIMHSKDTPSYQLAALLCGITFSELSDDAQAALNAYPENLSASLIPTQYNWYLCSTAERKFQEALDTHRWVHAGSMAIKGVGRLVGLPTRTIISTTDTIFLKNIFYSPVNNSTRRFLRGSLGSRTIATTIPHADWVPLRTCTQDKLSDLLNTRIASAPNSHPDSKKILSAEEHRRKYEEEMDV